MVLKNCFRWSGRLCQHIDSGADHVMYISTRKEYLLFSFFYVPIFMCGEAT